MPRRGENVYKRRDGRWEGRILRPDGKYQYVYARTYKEVKGKKLHCQENLKMPQKKECGPTTYSSELFETWLNGGVAQRVKPSTYENYYYCMKKFIIPFFDQTEDRRITAQATERFVQSIHGNDDLSDAYKRKILTIFKTALKEILKGSVDYTAVMDAIMLPRAESATVQVFSIKEQRLVEHAAMYSVDRRELGIILCFYTGIRLGELCALQWGDIDFEAGTLSVMRTVSRTKNFQQGGNKTMLLVGEPKSRKSVRKIPLPDFLLKMSERYRKNLVHENDYLLSGTDTPLDPRSYQKIYKKVLLRAGVKERKFHAVRHTFATRALELGVDIKTLSEILGHANVSITLNIYAHSLMEQKKIAIDKLNQMHNNHMELASFAVISSVIPV